MDPLEEQRMEYEALTYIYPEELQLTNEDPLSFSVLVKPLDGGEVSATISFSMPAEYPASMSPVVEISSSSGLNNDDRSRIMAHIGPIMEENIGIVVVHTILSEIQMMLEDTQEQKAQKEAKEAEKMAIALAERAEFEKREKERMEHDPILDGPLCTIESFQEWKLGFDAEIHANNNGNGPSSGLVIEKKTGRQLFEEETLRKEMLAAEEALIDE